METIEATLVGTLPLIMHNSQLADPLNEWSQAISEISSIRKKAVEDHEEMRRLEWFGSLYLDEKNRPTLPAPNVFKCLVEGARKTKNGKSVERSVIMAEQFFPLEYEGPKDPKKLFEKKQFVDVRVSRLKASGSSVVRCRPIFRQWSASVAMFVETDEVDVAKVLAALKYAGERLGIGDYRPHFGRFSVEVSS